MSPSAFSRLLVPARGAVVLAVSWAAALAAAAEGEFKPMVVGGGDALADEFPWMMALVRTDSEDYVSGQFCGAVLIHPDWALTAAHCVDRLKPEEFLLVYGSGDLSEATRTTYASAILLHPMYSHQLAFGGDVALLRLERRINDIAPLHISGDPALLDRFERATAVGWGKTDPLAETQVPVAKLQKVEARLISNAEVNAPHLFDGQISPTYVALGEASPWRGAGSGDSGGPLLVKDGEGNWIGAGIASFGGLWCWDAGRHITLYSKIGVYNEWIQTQPPGGRWDPPDWAFEDLTKRMVSRETADSDEYGIGIRVWPFSGPVERLRWATSWSHSAHGTHYLQWRNHYFSTIWGSNHMYLSDGSFAMFPEAASLGDRAVLWKLEPELQGSSQPANAPLAFSPFAEMAIRSTHGSAKMRLLLSDLEVGPLYTFSQWQSYDWLVAREGSAGLERTVGGGWPDYSSSATFSAEFGDRLWLEGITGYGTLSFSLAPKSIELLPENIGVTRTLSEAESHSYRRPGKRLARFRSQSTWSGEKAFTLTSAADMELEIYDSREAQRLASMDEFGPGGTERLIVSMATAASAIVRVSNVDDHAMGTYTLKVADHFTPTTFRIPHSSQRAITREDESSYYSEYGYTQYFETISLVGADAQQDLRVRIRGAGDFYPAMAVYEAPVYELIAVDYTEPCWWQAEIVFRPKAGRRYELIVAAFDESDLDGNFFLEIESGNFQASIEGSGAGSSARAAGMSPRLQDIAIRRSRQGRLWTEERAMDTLIRCALERRRQEGDD